MKKGERAGRGRERWGLESGSCQEVFSFVLVFIQLRGVRLARASLPPLPCATAWDP